MKLEFGKRKFGKRLIAILGTTALVVVAMAQPQSVMAKVVVEMPVFDQPISAEAIGAETNSKTIAERFKNLGESKPDFQRHVAPLLGRFETNDASVADVSETGVVSTSDFAGDTHVVISYDNAVVPVPVVHPYASASAYQRAPTPTRIDELVVDKLEQLAIQPSELSDDAMFLRRVCLDITGTLPSPDEIRKFLNDDNPEKRRAKIDQLLESPAYAAWWTTFFCDMTENNSRQLRDVFNDTNAVSKQWYSWIYNRVEGNVRYDEMVEGIVLGASRDEGEGYTEYCERMSGYFRDGKHGNDKFAENESMPYYWMRNFSRALPRRLPAEVVFDAVNTAASSPDRNREYRNEVEKRAISIPGTLAYNNNKGKNRGVNSSFAMQVFGRSERSSSCDCDRSEETSLIQTVYLKNDRDIHLMLTQKGSWVNQLAEKQRSHFISDADQNRLKGFEKRIKQIRSQMVKTESTMAESNKNQSAKRKKQLSNLRRQLKGLVEKAKPLRESIEQANKRKSDSVELNLVEFVEEAYLRTLSRFPTNQETQSCVAHIEASKDFVNGVTGVMWALVNTKEFIVNH